MCCNRCSLCPLWLAGIPLHLDIYDLADNNLADIIYHLVKNLKALKLILQKRVLLSVCTQVHSLPQGIQVLKVLLPLHIDKSEVFHPCKHVEVLCPYFGRLFIHLAVDIVQNSLLKVLQCLKRCHIDMGVGRIIESLAEPFYNLRHLGDFLYSIEKVVGKFSYNALYMVCKVGVGKNFLAL